MPIPESTRHSLSQRLNRRRVERWPSLSALDIKFRANFAYVKGINSDGAVPLLRLQYGGSASRWGFAIYLASHGGYERAVLPTGLLAGSPEEALDCACALYVGDEEPWHERELGDLRAPLFSRRQLTPLFDPAVIARGQALADTIDDLYEDEWSIVGTVADGKRSFLAMVHHGNGPLSTECDCPEGRTGVSCEHAAAVGLCYVDGW
jgi:hypothetical protein